MKAALVFCTLLVLIAQPSHGQDAPATAAAAPKFSIVSFTFKPNGAADSSWSLVSFGDGTGTYRVRREAKWIEMPLTLHEGTLQALAKGEAKAHERSCETKLKNIAHTGMKTLMYGIGPSALDCTFNYSDDEGVNAAADAFQAIVETLQMGEQLRHERRFDRLGLNAALDSLAAEAKDGRALELQNIAPILQGIVDDDDLMGVVRRKAKSLLQDASLHPGK